MANNRNGRERKARGRLAAAPLKQKTAAAQPAKEARPALKGKAGALPVAGVGASAGGLEALEGLFAHMPSDCGLAFVVIQHLAPTYKSIMGSILSKNTGLKVLEIRDGLKIRPNHVYLNPPDRDVAIINGALRLIEPVEAHAERTPINYFLRSLADDLQERAIGIILSGTGTDGTLGAKAIKAAGGLVVVQDEKQAKYSGMPGSAIDAGAVDFILPVEKMAEALMAYARHPYIKEAVKPVPEKEKLSRYIEKACLLIRTRTGRDFSNYKTGTIRRRIEKRMAIHRIEKLEDYARYLEQTPAEVDDLYKDFLIGVTGFFRDPEAFDVLGKKVLPGVLKDRPTGSPVRVWVPGCATGEEAYSIAMVLTEASERLKKRFDITVFATDIDSNAINFARAAKYPDDLLTNMTRDRLDRFFTKEGNGYQIRRDLRETVVFAEQSLIKDPPFTKLDMICCRNVLIYLNSTLQKKIIPLFHYSLNRDGILFLGSSETIGGFSDLFTPVDMKWKIYRSKPAFLERRSLTDFAFTEAGAAQAREAAAPRAMKTSDIREIAEKFLLDSYSPPGVLVNHRFEIIYFHGHTDKYLSPPSGEPSFNLLKMAHEDLRRHISIALHRTLKLKKPVVIDEIELKTNGSHPTVKLSVRPVIAPGEDLMMVVFEEKKAGEKEAPKKKAKAKAKGRKAAEDPRIAALETELGSTREYLQTTIEELETSNEELKSANEEMQSTNEELQSTNEELETAKEELQSTNEELNTVNSELESKVNELSVLNDDLNNLLASTDVATLFLDDKLCIKRFTPTATRIFNLRSADAGRPVSDITSAIVDGPVSEVARKVLDTLIPQEVELRTADGKCYSLRVLPYRTTENVIDGIVMTFVDITEIKRCEEEAVGAKEFLTSIFDTIIESLLIVDRDLRVVSANRSFYRSFSAIPAETEGRLVYEIRDRMWDIPELRRLLEDIIPENTVVEGFRVSHEFPVVGKKTFLLNARRIAETRLNPAYVLIAMADVTVNQIEQ